VGLPRRDQPFVSGCLETAAGEVARVESELTFRDLLGGWKVRWNIGRTNYKVDPGLYALGHPDEDSPVFVSANFKMSFDLLRKSLGPGRNGWILVLDTEGINVWCAAGKGTFGTGELVERIVSSGLGKVVKHRTLIVPQLGAPGVCAREVQKLSGFKVFYGPVRAKDLPDFLDSGMKARSGMRIKTFETGERMSLVPVELVNAMKIFLPALPVIFLLSGFGERAAYVSYGLRFGAASALAVLAAIGAGCVLTPLLLPWLPGKAFSLKGLWPGIVCALLFLSIRDGLWGLHPAGAIEIAAWMLIVPAFSAYLAMNFTGCSTFTSLSGVKKEMKWALPAQIVAGALGTVLWVTSLFLR
jgi:acetyl-CoA decarbonylase/synthase complex subunit gamma